MKRILSVVVSAVLAGCGGGVGGLVSMAPEAPDMERARGGGAVTEYEEACAEVYTVEGRFRACGLPWCDPGHPGTCVTPMPIPFPQDGAMEQ